jgi:hypothetical protein
MKVLIFHAVVRTINSTSDYTLRTVHRSYFNITTFYYYNAKAYQISPANLLMWSQTTLHTGHEC